MPVLIIAICHQAAMISSWNKKWSLICLLLSGKNNIEQYNNLQLRCEILDGEQDSIMRTIERLDQDKKSEEMQILSIEKQQQKLEDEIEELRER